MSNATSDPEPAAPESKAQAPEARVTEKFAIAPAPGEVIVSSYSGSTYTIEHPIGEGSFGVVYGCVDDWNNQLAAKILKPTRSYEEVKAAALRESMKLVELRHPQITHFYDAFEYRDTLNGERINIESCNIRDLSDTAICMVGHPDHVMKSSRQFPAPWNTIDPLVRNPELRLIQWRPQFKCHLSWFSIQYFFGGESQFLGMLQL